MPEISECGRNTKGRNVKGQNAKGWKVSLFGLSATVGLSAMVGISATLSGVIGVKDGVISDGSSMSSIFLFYFILFF